MARRIIRRKVIRPNLKDYLRTGVVQVVNIYEYETGDSGELFDEDDELDVINANASAGANADEVPEKTVAKAKRRSRKSKARFESVPSEPAVVAQELAPAQEVVPAAIDEAGESGETITNEGVAKSADERASAIENAASADEAQVFAQAFLDLLASDDRPMWDMILVAVTNITREELDIKALRGEFEAMTPEERDRFTYYLLLEKGAKLVPVQRAEQISEPACCVLRWDENGAARFSLKDNADYQDQAGIDPDASE